MKTIKILILTLTLAGATYAGEIGQPAPQPPPQQTTRAVVKEMLVVICQSLLSLR